MKKIFRLLSIPAVFYSVLAVLVAGVGILAYLNFKVLKENITAEEDFKTRETAVIEHQKVLKSIVEMYYKTNSKYPATIDDIVEFAKSGYIVMKSEIYDPNNLGKVKEVRPGAVDKVWGEFSKDTIWEEPSYRLLVQKELKKNPEWKNEKVETILVRDTLLKGYSAQEISDLCYIPYSNKEKFQVRINSDSTCFRCHAPYVSFFDTEKYPQQFWNFIEEKFNYFVKNNDSYKETCKLMAADGAHKAITSEVTITDENGNKVTRSKYHIGNTPEKHIDIDIEFFGVTFGSLDKRTLDGSWEDQRAKK